LQRARYTVSSRTIDDAHRPRIVRRAPATLAHRPRPSPTITGDRRSKLSVALGVVLAGWATLLPVSIPQWPFLIASSASISAPPAPGGAPRTGVVTLTMPVAPAGATMEEARGGASTASGGAPSTSLNEPLAVMAADERLSTDEFIPPGPRLDTATVTETSKPSIGDGERLRARSTRSQRPHSLALARVALPASPRHRQIVVQLSSYNDETRAQQAAEKLHRSLQKILKDAHVRTKEAEVHGQRVWRVVAGPVADRERGRRLCDAIHHAGQSCVVMLL
jgi:hypothetical protein